MRVWILDGRFHHLRVFLSPLALSNRPLNAIVFDSVPTPLHLRQMNPPTPNLPEDCMGVIVSFIKDRDGLAAASRLCRHFRIRARERYLSAPYLILPVSHEWDFRIEGDDDDDVESDVKDKHSNVMVHLCNGKKGATTRYEARNEE